MLNNTIVDLFSVGILQQSLNLFFGCSTYGQKQIPGVLWQFCIRKKGIIPSIPYTNAYIKNKNRGLFTFVRGDNKILVHSLKQKF
jgi:hypothetical protein